MQINAQDIVLKEAWEIYNNQAYIDSCKGRLFAQLLIYPKPLIKWDFEVVNVREIIPKDFPTVHKNLNKKFFEGYNIILQKISVTSNPLSSPSCRRALGRGYRAYWGDPEAPGKYFSFYLPNTRFLAESKTIDPLIGTIHDQRIISESILTKSNLREQKEIGKFIEFKFEEKWMLRLEVKEPSIEWLKQKNNNIGTLITCQGLLHIENEDTDDQKGCSLSEAEPLIRDFCLLISFANCGFIAPVIISNKGVVKIDSEMFKNYKQIRQLCMLFDVAHQITPLDSLGVSWVTSKSNLHIFCRCFKAFRRMLEKNFWRDSTYFVMIQYFQAAKYGNWEVCISAIDAALERLSYVILVQDLIVECAERKHEFLFKFEQERNEYEQNAYREFYKNEKYKYINATGKLKPYSQAVVRLCVLLEQVGLLQDADPALVQKFRAVRNDAVHARNQAIDDDERWNMVEYGLRWVEEIILWRLGYDSYYFDRVNRQETLPRYTLESRNPNW